VGQNHQPLNEAKAGKPNAGALKERLIAPPDLHQSD